MSSFDVFAEVKRRVTIREVCERYGVTIPERLFRSIRTIRDITSVIQAKTAPA